MSESRVVVAVARAIFEHDEVSHHVPAWDDGLHETLKERYLRMAVAAIETARQEDHSWEDDQCDQGEPPYTGP